VAKPDSTIRIEESRYGTSSAFTTKPERSAERTTCLPSTSPANAWARLDTDSPVLSVVTSSTSGSTGTGLKKCMPITRSGFAVATAIFMIGMEEVLEASTASGSVTTLSSSLKIEVFTFSSSTTASTTSWRSAKSPRSEVNRSRQAACSRSRSVILPLLTPRSSDRRMRERPAAASSRVCSKTSTSICARAHTSAIPAPICPAPITPTR